MEEYGVGREMVRQFLSPLAATGYGLGCDAMSGFVNPDFYPLLHDKNQCSFPGYTSTRRFSSPRCRKR